MRPDQLPFEMISSARFFHTSAISQAISTSACDTVFAAIETARAAGVAVAYDSNLRLRLWPLPRAKAVITATAALADYFLPSLDDVKILCGLERPDAIVDWCHRLGARHVALKLGPDGVLASDGHSRRRIPGHTVDCVDATGAGDCFAGSFLACLASGADFWDAARYGNAAAALATTGFGAVAPLPRPVAVKALLGTDTE